MAALVSSTKPSVLIVCIGNSCRSQLAEGLLRSAAGDRVEVFSAGARPAGFVQPKAIQVLKEIGIDISHHRSKHLNEFIDRDINVVITVCGENDACPVFPGQVTRHHWPFSDPSHAVGSDEQITAEFRRSRDEIKRVFDAYAAGLGDGFTLLRA